MAFLDDRRHEVSSTQFEGSCASRSSCAGRSAEPADRDGEKRSVSGFGPRRALHETFLDQIRLNDLLDDVPLVTECGCHGLDTDRTAAKFLAMQRR